MPLLKKPDLVGPSKGPGAVRRQGGTRPGAGRKPVDSRFKKVQVGLKLPQWMSEDLAALSRAVGVPVSPLIEMAIASAYKFNPPTLQSMGRKPEGEQDENNAS